MRYACWIISIFCMCGVSCKKSTSGTAVPEVRGLSFDLLLKTVDTYVDGKTSTTYTYDNFQRLIGQNSATNFNDGTNWEIDKAWYRNSTGQPDSMTTQFTYGSSPPGQQKHYYHYDPSGTLTYSIFFRNAFDPSASVDSMVYTYSGSHIVQRFDYTTAPSTLLNNTLTHEIYYQYDTSNNISAILFINYDFSGGLPPNRDTVTLSYSYDQKKNPYYQNEADYAYYVALAFENYASRNNIVQVNYGGNASANDKDQFSFQYNAANKPDRVSMISYKKGSSQPTVRATDYYYN